MLPVSLPDVRAYLRIEDSDLDVDLRGAIDAAIADMEAMTSTRLAPQVGEISRTREQISRIRQCRGNRDDRAFGGEGRDSDDSPRQPVPQLNARRGPVTPT